MEAAQHHIGSVQPLVKSKAHGIKRSSLSFVECKSVVISDLLFNVFTSRFTLSISAPFHGDQFVPPVAPWAPMLSRCLCQVMVLQVEQLPDLPMKMSFTM